MTARSWPLTDVPIAFANVCFREERKWRGLAAVSEFDPTRTFVIFEND